MRWIVGGKPVERQAASTSQMGRFETELLATDANIEVLAGMNGAWIDKVHDRRPPKMIILDMDSIEILSIDIADIDVGENIGARLKIDQAEAEKKVAQAQAQAQAERQRALAVAREQEMVALVQENRAKVVLAEAEVPKAMADAFRAGNMGVMDYYNMQNVISDTRMRTSIADPDRDEGPPTEDA